MNPFTGHALAACAVLAFAVAARGQDAGGFIAYVADPMDKVLPNSTVPDDPETTVRIEAARGEIENAQIVLRSEEAVAGIRVEVGDLADDAGDLLPVSCLEVGRIGFVPIEANTVDTPPEELIATAPCEIPDPIFPAESVDLEPGRAQPLWLTLRVPRDAAPGVYRGEVRIASAGHEAVVPVEATIWSFEVPRDRHLFYTNWCSPDQFAQKHGVEMWSEGFWSVLETYLDMMAEHRQNVLWVSPATIAIFEEPDGSYAFDFSRFDRWVGTCEKHGVADRIEISQIGGFGEGGWAGSEIVLYPRSVTVRTTGETRSVPAEQILPPFLSALQEHLRERGWLGKTLLHIADEPSENNTASWSAKAAFTHEAAPEIRIIDAIEGPVFEDLDVWVPKLTHLRNWLPYYEQARARGAELWFYTCCHPTGLYPNRFLDYSLLKTRILHWYNWRYDLPGYLHWGLNFWTDDPYAQVTSSGLPPGDCFIVYPGEKGPISSIRWDALRDGIEDYEYLWVLRDATARALGELGSSLIGGSERADEVARSVVRDFTDYARSNAEIWSARRAIAEEIEALSGRPRLIVATDPPTSEPLVPGPIVVRVRGVTEPGASVEVNGQSVVVGERGEFRLHVFLSPESPTVRVNAALGGETKAVFRTWAVQRQR